MAKTTLTLSKSRKDMAEVDVKRPGGAGRPRQAGSAYISSDADVEAAANAKAKAQTQPRTRSRMAADEDGAHYVAPQIARRHDKVYVDLGKSAHPVMPERAGVAMTDAERHAERCKMALQAAIQRGEYSLPA